MSEISVGFADQSRKKSIIKIRWVAMVGIPLVAILFQVYVPRFFPFLAYLELPLLVTVYFALMRRSPPAGVLFGAAIGLAQDSLSNHPLGMFGIVKTLVGYFAASVSQRFDVDNSHGAPGPGVLFFLFPPILLLGAGAGAAGRSAQLRPSADAW